MGKDIKRQYSSSTKKQKHLNSPRQNLTVYSQVSDIHTAAESTPPQITHSDHTDPFCYLVQLIIQGLLGTTAWWTY